jgi:DNA gyrase subunit A
VLLPDVRDGLKPVHRRILYTMNERWPKANWLKYRKSANVTGAVMGRYHPHGNAAIYDAMVRLAQPWSMRYMLVMDRVTLVQWTEIHLLLCVIPKQKWKAAEELLVDIDKETVDLG